MSADSTGEEFADRADAVALATAVAQKLSEVSRISGCILIVDENGEEIGRVPVTPAPKSLAHISSLLE